MNIMMNQSAKSSFLFLFFFSFLTPAFGSNNQNIQSCEQVLSAPAVPQIINISDHSPLSRQKLLNALDLTTPVEIRFATLKNYIDIQNADEEFLQNFFDKLENFALQLNTQNQTNFLNEIEQLKRQSMKAAIKIRLNNNLYLQTLIPFSYFAKRTAQDHFIPEVVEQDLDREWYIIFNDDGSPSLKNFDYRKHMIQQLKQVLRPGERLTVFRGMNSAHSNFMTLMAAFSKGQSCASCRRDLVSAMKIRQEFDADSLTDEELLRLVHSQLFKYRHYIFTTPDPRWANHWGAVHELRVDLHSLSASVLERIYIASDSAHNIGVGVIEIDFSMANFSDVVNLFAHTEIRDISRNVPFERVTPNGTPIPTNEDLRHREFWP